MLNTMNVVSPLYGIAISVWFYMAVTVGRQQLVSIAIIKLKKNVRWM